MFMPMVRGILRDESGIETAEWVIILAIVCAVAFFVYGVNTGGGVQGALSTVVSRISSALGTLTP